MARIREHIALHGVLRITPEDAASILRVDGIDVAQIEGVEVMNTDEVPPGSLVVLVSLKVTKVHPDALAEVIAEVKSDPGYQGQVFDICASCMALIFAMQGARPAARQFIIICDECDETGRAIRRLGLDGG
jgi:hypothetical protein